jgi:hypothetical protein
MENKDVASEICIAAEPTASYGSTLNALTADNSKLCLQKKKNQINTIDQIKTAIVFNFMLIADIIPFSDHKPKFSY